MSKSNIALWCGMIVIAVAVTFAKDTPFRLGLVWTGLILIVGACVAKATWWIWQGWKGEDGSREKDQER